MIITELRRARDDTKYSQLLVTGYIKESHIRGQNSFSPTRRPQRWAMQQHPRLRLQTCAARRSCWNNWMTWRWNCPSFASPKWQGAASKLSKDESSTRARSTSCWTCDPRRLEPCDAGSPSTKRRARSSKQKEWLYPARKYALKVWYHNDKDKTPSCRVARVHHETKTRDMETWSHRLGTTLGSPRNHAPKVLNQLRQIIVLVITKCLRSNRNSKHKK